MDTYHANRLQVRSFLQVLFSVPEPILLDVLSYPLIGVADQQLQHLLCEEELPQLHWTRGCSGLL